MSIFRFMKFALAGLLLVSFSASADLIIQTAQYKAEKGALFVKGKVEGADRVYVVDSDTDELIGAVMTKRKQFQADIPVGAADVPCTVQIQTNEPTSGGGGGWWWTASTTNDDPGDFSIAPVLRSTNCE